MLKRTLPALWNYISNDPLAQSHLRSRCVSGKLNLTMRQETTIDFRHKNKALRLRITRDTFESLTEDLLKRCEERLHNALEEAEYTTEDIDTVLLVGGSTRMPMVRKRIKKSSSETPFRTSILMSVSLLVQHLLHLSKWRVD